MIESTWQCDYGQDGRRLWKQMLHDHDPDLAVHAIARLSKTQRFKPMIADLAQLLKHLQEDARSKVPGIPEQKFGKEPPEWVWVWGWCRNMRAPRNYLPFPQQLGFVDETQMMSPEAYKELREEWVTAGSPRKLWGTLKAA